LDTKVGGKEEEVQRQLIEERRGCYRGVLDVLGG